MTLPADDTTTGGDDVTLPGDDTTSGGDDVTLPGDDTTAGGDDVTLPADDTTTGGDDVTLSANDTTTGGDDVTLPADDTSTGGDDDTLPADDTTPSDDDVTIPADDTTPADDDNVTVPAEVAIPGNDASEEVQEKVAALADELTSGTDNFESITAETVTDSEDNTSTVTTDGDIKTTLLDNADGTTTADYSQTTDRKDVTTSTGNQSITFNSEGGNVARINRDTTGEKVVETGGGGDIVINANKEAAVTIKSTGDDTIVASGSTGERIELGGGSAVIVAAEGAKVSNYDVNTGAGFILTGVENLSDALITGTAALTDKSLTYNNNSQLNISKAADNTTTGTFVNVYTASSAEESSSKALVGWADDDGQLDATEVEEAAILIGNSYNDSGKTSTIVASAQDNTIFAGAQDVVSLSGGADLIVANGGTQVENYDANTGAGFLFSGLDDLIGAIESRDLELGDNSISYSTAGAVSLTGNTSASSSANVYSNAHTKTKTVWTHQTGGKLKLSDTAEPAVLVGNYLGEKSGASEIEGGAGDDTILGGNNDTINRAKVAHDNP